MKKITFLFIYFICLLTYSQQSKDITIEWTEKQANYVGDIKINVPQFKSDSYNYDSYNKQLFYGLKLKTNSYSDENSLQITNVVYESISDGDLGDLSRNVIPTSINQKLINSLARDQYFVSIILSPIIKDGDGYKRIKSFSYSFNASTSSKLNSVQNLQNIANSVLSSGNWYRFYVEKSGVYKLSKSFLESIGLKTSGIDARKIKIYGNGGRMLPLTNSVFYPNDLEENAIQVIGESDGTFDSTDYILFYAEGVDTYNDESRTNVNLYSDKSYYYVTVEGNDGKRIAPNLQPTNAATTTTTVIDQNQVHEVDLNNIVKTGRQWYGEEFAINNDLDIEFKTTNIVPASTINLNIHVGSASFNPTSLAVKSNEVSAGTINLSPLTIDSGIEATEGFLSTTIPANETIKINLNFDNGGVPSSKAFLDYIRLSYKGNLKGFGKQYLFQNNSAATTTGIIEYQVSNANKIRQVWDVTDIYNVSKFENTTQNINFSFKSNLGEIRKYVAIDDNDYYFPSKEAKSKVANQNLKGTIFNDKQGNFKDIDYLIITPKNLSTQAEKLANFHRNYSNLNVKVVDLESIYQEFSSGKQDIGAIRNFVKYVYQNASNTSSRVQFLNLFGDASFDFKDRIRNNTNIVPIFHALNSFSAGESSFASDDFFALMDDNEGNVENTGFGSSGTGYGIDIAVGRMIVSGTQQAEEMVNKVLEYHDLKSYGSWRNNYVSIADDPDTFKTGDYNLEFIQNQVTDQIIANKPFLNFKKILTDGYQQITSAGGDRYPKAREEILSSFEKGALIFNYLGHGGEDGLANERIWNKPDGTTLNNQYRYPLFITLTCDFSRFDNPLRQTAGEFTYWNPKGGAISMITTIRSIGQFSAESFNGKLMSKLLSYNSNTYYSIAESLRQAKNEANTFVSSSRVVFYIGDPALMLAIAKPRIVLTKINDVAINQPIDDFKALSYVKISGEVQDENGQLLTSYNGELATNIFDKNFIKSTFGNDGQRYTSGPQNGQLIILDYNSMGETIFRGNSSISAGKFEFGFVVPKDIKIPLGNGKISFYSKRNQLLLDKSGLNVDIKVGGINTNAPTDTTAPTVRLYMNDETFVNGGITNESPFFLAFLNDENGINTASGIGHDLVALLDGDETNPYILNDYYETELDNYKKGKIRFPFRNLSKGLHTITLKAWDVYNNFVTAEIQFLVVDDGNITLKNVLNYPNPFVSYTQFWFTHNKPFEPLDVQVQIMTITGKIVKTINQSVTTDGFLSREVTWDGKDDFGDRIGKGVYIYKLTVRSTLTNKKSEKIEKLVIL